MPVPSRPHLWLIGVLLAAIYLWAGLWLRHHANPDPLAIWSHNDEVFAHAPEMQRIAAGGELAANDSLVAFAPGMHFLYVKLLDLLGANVEVGPWEPPGFLQLFNLALSLVLAAVGARWVRRVLPDSPPWWSALLGLLLLSSPYTLSSGLWLTSDNFGMTLFFATGLALTAATTPGREAIAGAVAALTIFVRHIYVPAFAALPLWAFIVGDRRRASIVVGGAAVLVFLPFGSVWHGLVPQVYASVHKTWISPANAMTMCVFAVYLAALMAPMLRWPLLLGALRQRAVALSALAAAMLALAVVVAMPETVEHSPARYQDGALLYLLAGKLSRFGFVWDALAAGSVTLGAAILGAMAALAWRDVERRLPLGLLGLQLAALCFQERPYQRYFEGLMLVAFFMLLGPWLRNRPVAALPLLAVWLLQLAIYLRRLS